MNCGSNRHGCLLSRFSRAMDGVRARRADYSSPFAFAASRRRDSLPESHGPDFMELGSFAHFASRRSLLQSPEVFSFARSPLGPMAFATAASFL